MARFMSSEANFGKLAMMAFAKKPVTLTKDKTVIDFVGNNKTRLPRSKSTLLSR